MIESIGILGSIFILIILIIFIWTMAERRSCAMAGLAFFSFFFSSIWVISCMFTLMLTEPNKEIYLFKETPIYTLRNDNQIEGSFFLGSGQIGSSIYYVTFVKHSDDTFELMKYNHENFRILEGVSEPYLKQYNVKSSAPTVSLWFGSNFQNSEKIHHYECGVPTGTIIKKFSVN